MSTHSFPAEVRQRLNLLTGDALRLEQYKDFFWNRPFRQTLLCHANAPVRNEVGPSEVTGFFIASPARPVSSSPDLHSTAVEQFRAPSGLTLHSAEPIGKAAMVHLAEMWPQPIQFDQLLAAAREKLGQPMATALDTEKLAGMLLAAYTIGATKLMEFRTHTPAFILQPGEFPVASPLARWQARTSSSVTNLRHERLTLDDFDRSTLPYLDGRNNREALLKVHIDRAVRGELRLHRSGQPIVSKSAMHSALEEVLTVQLTRLSRMALLQS
jgi:methyltransferase-like protein